MAHASTFHDRFTHSNVLAPSLRPSSWQRFLDALERLGMSEEPSQTTLSYAHAFRTQPVPSIC